MKNFNLKKYTFNELLLLFIYFLTVSKAVLTFTRVGCTEELLCTGVSDQQVICVSIVIIIWLWQISH